MFEVKVSPQAAADLLEIKDYIENELLNPIAAQNTLEKIVETYCCYVDAPLERLRRKI